MTNTFLSDESGAVTVDWVVLTAALVGLGLATTAVVTSGVSALSGNLATELTEQGLDAIASSILDLGVISPHHSQAWLDQVVPDFFGDPAIFSDAELAAYHTTMANTILAANPADIASGHYHNSIDHMGAVEAAMANRGITIPDTSGIDYTTARSNFDANPV